MIWPGANLAVAALFSTLYAQETTGRRGISREPFFTYVLHGLQSSFKFVSPYFRLIIRFISDFRVIGASYLFHCPLNLLMSLSIGNGSCPGPAVAKRTFRCRHVSQSPCEAQNRARQCALVAFCQCETATLNLTRRFALPQSRLCPNTVLCVCYWQRATHLPFLLAL